MTKTDDKETGVEIDVPANTIKTCDGMVDLYKSGFIIQLWTDVITVTDEFGDWKYTSKSEFKITGNNRRQFGENFDNYIHLKFVSPWIIREKTGVNFLLTSPVWNNANYWNYLHVLPGIVNFKTQSSSHVNMFVNKTNQTLHMEAGMPLVHVIPLSENKINIKCHLIDKDEEKKLDPSLSYFSFLNGHKKFKKMTEKKESESKCPFGFK